MKLTIPCLALTGDDAFFVKLKGMLHSKAEVTYLESLEKLEDILVRLPRAILLLDLRSRDSLLYLRQINRSPRHLVIAFGVHRSDPMLEVEGLEIFSIESVDIDRRRLHLLIDRAFHFMDLREENQSLRGEVAKPVSYSYEPMQHHKPTAITLRHLYRAFRHFKDIHYLLDNVVEGLASSTMVSRIGIFIWDEARTVYSLEAGLRCFEDVQSLRFERADPLVKWMENRQRLISRNMMNHVQDRTERMLLQQSLDRFGAELIFPLQSHGRLLGWLFLGERSTGFPFHYSDLEELMVVAEHISTNLENALLYEEVAHQKKTLEIILNSMKAGTVVMAGSRKIEWCNESAKNLLEVQAPKVLQEDASVLGSRMNDVLLRTLKQRKDLVEEWIDAASLRTLSVQTHLMTRDNQDEGAVAIIEDRTHEKMNQEKQEQTKHSQLWQELSSSLAHHIRNPLVAVRTFIQLLPERYDDPEFRDDFWKLIPKELDRLDHIIEEINHFANPKVPERKPVDIESVVQKGVDLARSWVPNGIKIQTSIKEKLPKIMGDSQSLAECVAHLVKNAVEATSNKKNPQIALTAGRWKDKNDLVVTIQDNGAGISKEDQENVFTPFRTTKPSALGLGLPIVRRTILNHKGKVTLNSNDKGTCVTISLPGNG